MARQDVCLQNHRGKSGGKIQTLVSAYIGLPTPPKQNGLVKAKGGFERSQSLRILCTHKIVILPVTPTLTKSFGRGIVFSAHNVTSVGVGAGGKAEGREEKK